MRKRTIVGLDCCFCWLVRRFFRLVIIPIPNPSKRMSGVQYPYCNSSCFLQIATATILCCVIDIASIIDNTSLSFLLRLSGMVDDFKTERSYGWGERVSSSYSKTRRSPNSKPPNRSFIVTAKIVSESAGLLSPILSWSGLWSGQGRYNWTPRRQRRKYSLTSQSEQPRTPKLVDPFCKKYSRNLFEQLLESM